MPRYSEFLYGQDLYGYVGGFNRRFTWLLQIDWDGDGDFTENEAGEIQKLSVSRGREFFLKSDNTGFEPLATGRLTATIIDLDHRLDPYNILSPLYPNVQPGKKFRLKVLDENTSTTYSVITGRITNIDPIFSGVNKVVISGTDEITYLQERSTPYTTMYENERVDDAIEALLSSIDWEYTSDIDNITDVIRYWWLSGDTAFDELAKLVDSVLAKWFIAKDGALTVLGRYSNAASVQSLHGDDVQMEVSFPAPWEVVKNSVKIDIAALAALASQELFSMSDKPLVTKAGGSIEVWASYTYSSGTVPGVDMIDPVATTDYLMNSLADGTGTNLTASFTVVATKYAFATKLVITNNHATIDGYVTMMKIRGKPLVTSSTFIEQKDTASIALFKEKQMRLTNQFMQNTNNAEAVSDLLVSVLNDAKRFPRVSVINKPELQLTPELFDIVEIDITSLHIKGDFTLGYITHEWIEPTGQVWKTTFHFEPPVRMSGDYWIFTETMGVGTIFG